MRVRTPTDFMVGALMQMLMPWLTRAQDGPTLIRYVIDKDDKDTLKALLDRGADPNSRNTVGARVERVYKSVKGGGLFQFNARLMCCYEYSHDGVLIDRKASTYSHTLLKSRRKPA